MTGSTSVSSTQRAASRLGDLLASVEVSNDWDEVARTAEALANDLRNRGGPVDEHTVLGKTMLPQTLTSLLKVSLEGLRTPDETRAAAVFELLRVGANLCLDHNSNRGFLLEVGFPQIVVSLLEGYAEFLPSNPQAEPLPLAIPHLKVVKTAIGVILNLSLGYEPVQTRLISLEAAVTLLRLSTAIYPSGSWLYARSTPSSPSTAEVWALRSSISEWSWRAISGLKDNKAGQPLFGPDSLPSLVAPLRAFIPPFPSTSLDPIFANVSLRHTLLTCDIDTLEEVSELLESLTADVEDVRLALARGVSFPEEQGGRSCLLEMLNFVEHGDFPAAWTTFASDIPPQELSRWHKSVETCKTAIIKAIVETAGEERNLEVLWDVAEAEEGEGFVARMVSWLRNALTTPPSEARDDLVICSSLSLGNLVRREHHSITLVKPPISVVPLLVAHLRPDTDLKVKHGIIGLLKHLSQALPNRPLLGEAGVLQCLRQSQVFSEAADIADIVQMSAVGLSKHLCTGNVQNSITLVLDPPNDPSSSCLSQILALVRRSDAVPIKSEGTRVLVNAIKSLCGTSGAVDNSRRQEAISQVVKRECADVLAQLLGRSKKHGVLLNEAVISLYLLSLQPSGAPFVVDAIVTQLPKEITPHRSIASIANATNETSSPVVTPSTALDMLVTILKNAEPNQKFPAEMRMNLCVLLAELGKEGLKSAGGQDRSAEVERVRHATKGLLEAAASSSESLPLAAAARKALHAWES